MLTWINKNIDYLLQPELLRSENLQTVSSDEYIPVPSDIVIPSLVTAILFVGVRHIFDRFVVYPIGRYFGLKDSSENKRVIENPILENEYTKSRNPKPGILTMLSKKTGLSEKHLQIWFRRRKKQDKVSDFKRLSDSSWSFVFYFSLSWYGIYVLWDKSWTSNTEDCWKGWPQLAVTRDVYWYYLLELGYYISYLYMLFTDHKRKDFWEFFVHHNVTVLLMMLSWSHNVVRIGTLVLCIHDPVDYILALAKSAGYCKKQGVADICFVIFLPLWLVTRLFVYPYIVLYTAFVELPKRAEQSDVVSSLDGMVVLKLMKLLLLVLQVLHVMWTIHILKSAATKFTRGKLQDARSDTEEESDEDETVYDKDFEKIFNNNELNNIKCNDKMHKG